MRKKSVTMDCNKQQTLLGKVKKELRENRELYLMAIPVILYYLIFCYGPMFGIVIAFKDYNITKGILESPWAGFEHFIDFFGNTYFWRLLRNTLQISIYSIIFGFPAPIIFALLINEISNSKFKKTVQTITYLPHFISLVVVCGMLTEFLSANGIISKVFSIITNQSPENMLGNPSYFKSIYVISDIWQGLGWGSIVYLAALTGVDTSLYEAAEIDGAGRFRKILSITIPAILPTIMVMLILRLGRIMGVGYEKIILLYSPATYETADVISSFVYRRGLQSVGQYSYTTAVGMFQSVVNLIVLCLSNYFSKRFTESGLF